MKTLSALIAAMLLAAACTGTGNDAEQGDADGPSSGVEQGGLVTSSLSELPQIPADGFVQIAIADFAAGVELQRVESDPFIDRLVAVTLPAPRTEGGIGFQFAMPELFQYAVRDEGEFESLVGFPFDVIERYAEVTAPPEKATVFVGPSGWSGTAEPHTDGLLTIGQGDDFAVELGVRHSLDQLGRPVRLAEVDGRLASSLSTPVLLGWVDGTGARYSDDDRLTPLAAELDKHEVISALLFLGDFFAAPEFFPEDEEFPGLDEGIYISQPFVAVAIGNTVRDGRAIEVVSYRFLTDASAEAALPSIENAWTNGESIAVDLSVAEMTEFESIEQNGPVVTVVSVVPDNRVAPALNMLFSRDVTMAHS